MKPFKWIGIDWGTTNLRAFAINENEEIVGEGASDQGMGKLLPNEFEAALISLISPWLSSDKQVPVFACGMVGARQGWREAKYRRVPCKAVTDEDLTIIPTRDKRIKVHVLAGLSQACPADIMRGEETQIAGFLSKSKKSFDSICLPGTHSKWVSVSKDQIIEFTTYMTGEMFDLLSSKSVIRHSVNTEEWINAAFLEAANNATRQPEKVIESQFGLRAASLLNGTTPGVCRARLSGMLIGQELGMAKRYWDGKSVALIGSHSTVPLYRQALNAQGCNVEIVDTRAATLAGLSLVAMETIGKGSFNA